MNPLPPLAMRCCLWRMRWKPKVAAHTHPITIPPICSPVSYCAIRNIFLYRDTYFFLNTRSDGQLYSATVADFSGSDYLIYRETQRTEQYDLKQLNQPDFVSVVERNEHVLFFFREIAMEYMNCGKAVYSRVGRVCKSDRGGPYKASDRWTSFLKARLKCSVPGDYPFYFDDIREYCLLIALYWFVEWFLMDVIGNINVLVKLFLL